MNISIWAGVRIFPKIQCSTCGAEREVFSRTRGIACMVIVHHAHRVFGLPSSRWCLTLWVCHLCGCLCNSEWPV